jgi:hypothetical protein
MGFVFGAKRSESPVHWSKDYVEHLRAVHFDLVALSAALVVLATSAKTYDSPAALTQIDFATKLKNKWSLSWINDQRAARLVCDERVRIVRSRRMQIGVGKIAVPDFIPIAPMYLHVVPVRVVPICTRRNRSLKRGDLSVHVNV